MVGRLVRAAAIALGAGGWLAVALDPLAGIVGGWLLGLLSTLAPPYVDR